MRGALIFPIDNKVIRKATFDDLAVIEQTATAAYEKYVHRMGQKPAPMIADFTSQIEAGFIYVDCEEQEVQGFVVFYQRDEHIHLENLAVRPEAQRRGVGTRLVRFVEDTAKQSGFHAVELYTNEKMTENFGFYLHLGYYEIGRWEEEGFKRVFYRKDLLAPCNHRPAR